MSIENKLIYLDGTKDAIKQAIINKGVSVTESDTFRSYAEKIGQIESGGGEPSNPTFTGHADSEGLKAIGWTDEDIQFYQEHGVNWDEEEDIYHKVPQKNIDLYGVLTSDNIQTYKEEIVYLPKIDTSGKECNELFDSCKYMMAIPMIDTSSSTSFERMFKYCESLVCIPLIDTSNALKTNDMFGYCKSLRYVPELNTSNATEMYSMFSECRTLEKVPNLNTSKCLNLSNFFSNCMSLKEIPELDTSSCTNFSGLFSYCQIIKSIPQLNTSQGTKFDNMFSNCFCLQEIPQIDTSKATSTSLMFSSCLSLSQIPNLNLSLIRNFFGVFDGCKLITNVGELDITSSTSTTFPFRDCNNLVNAKVKNLKSNLEIHYSRFLSKESLLYIIQNAVPTSPITIKLHPKVYDEYNVDSDITSALEAQPNITLTK